MRRAFLVVVAAVSASACFAITDDITGVHGPTSDGGASSGGANEDLDMHFTNMVPHVRQYFEYRIIDASNFVQSRGIIDVVTSENFGIFVPHAIPKDRTNTPYRLDFWGDNDLGHGRTYGGIGSVTDDDHAWRLWLEDGGLSPGVSQGVTHAAGGYRVDFFHSTMFTEINNDPSGKLNPPRDTTLQARILIDGLGPHAGKLLQVRVAEPSPSNRVVGLYRLSKASHPSEELRIAGCVERQTPYSVELYIDANDNGAYDDPAQGAGDLGWRMQFTAGDKELFVTIDAAATMTGNVDVGRP